LTSLSDAAAESLGKHNDWLQLNGLTSLSDAAAESLGKHNDLLELNGLTSLSDPAAESLGKHNGLLELNGLTSLSDAAAESLGKHNDSLELNGLTSLSDAAAESLGKHNGRLELNGLSTLSDAAAESLGKYEGDLYLNDNILERINLIKEKVKNDSINKLLDKKELSAKEVFELYSNKLKDYEYLFFLWYGGGDSFNGFQLKEAKKGGEIVYGQDNKHEWNWGPNNNSDIIEKALLEKLNNSSIFDDFYLNINCVDQGWSNGVLLIALHELSEDFYWDTEGVIEAEEGFKGMKISGMNYEEMSNEIEL
jgi:hypothetical protein